MKKWLAPALAFSLMAGCLLGGCGTASLEKNSTSQATEVEQVEVVDDNIEMECEFEENSSENMKLTEETVGNLSVHFIDVGQGDCTLIGCDGHYLLIDAGDRDKGTTVQLYLSKQGVTSLDYVVGSHADADHIGGLDVILTKFDCGTVFMEDTDKDTKEYREVLDALKAKGMQYQVPNFGDTYALGEASFTIVGPNKKGSDDNNNSICVMVTNGENKFLFCGDAEEEEESGMLLSSAINFDADVLKISHHGSKYATSQIFYDAVSPEYAVISVGADNSYGHPSAEVLNRLRSGGTKLFRTDEQGSVIAQSDGENITFNCAPTETWQAGEATGASSEQKMEITYVLNTNSKKFHRPSCSSLPTSNRKDSTQSRDELIAAGYELCKRCNP